MSRIFKWIFLCLLQCLNLYGYQHDLSTCTIFRDDARFLQEWIEFHKLVGVQHFYLFDNLSQDDPQSVLEPYIRNGDVTLIQWPYESQDGGTWDRIQRNAYQRGLELSMGESKWLAFIDTDEFIVPMIHNNLIDFLNDYESYGGLGINWVTFGTSDVDKIPDGQLMIETLLYRARDGEANHTTIKSIVRPERVALPVGSVHYFVYQPGYNCVDADFEHVPREFTRWPKLDKIRLHHYRFRDRDFFFNVKIPRQAKYWSREQGIALESISNEVFDDTMLRFVPILKNSQRQ